MSINNSSYGAFGQWTTEYSSAEQAQYQRFLTEYEYQKQQAQFSNYTHELQSTIQKQQERIEQLEELLAGKVLDE